MALIDLQFEGEEEATQVATPEPQIELEFEDQGEGREPLAPGVTGYAEPVERDPFQWIRDTYMEGYTQARKNIAQQKGLAFDETAEDRARTGARVAELERQAEGYGMELDTMRNLQEISEADSITDAVGLMVKYPEAVAAVTLSSLGRFAPALAVTTGTAAATGGATLPLMGSTFMGSLAIEYGAVMDEEIRASGFDSEDPASWQRAVSDQEMLDRAKQRGLKRGIPIAAFDAISMGVAGKLLAGAKPAATSIVPRAAGEMGIQAGLGGAGEAAAQFVETGEVGAPGEVALEGVAELGPGIVETAIGYRGEKAQALRRQMAEQAGADAAQQVGDEALTPDFEVKSLEENATAIDEALAAAPPTPEVRPDEESITEKFDLEQEIEAPQTGLDLEQETAEQEANQFVLEQLRQQFPEATEQELLAAIEVYKPPVEELPSEEDLGWVAPEPAEPTPSAVSPKPDQDARAFKGEQAPAETEPEAAPGWEPVEEITRDEVVQATEQVEPTGAAIDTAETVRTARPEFQGLIFSFKPGDQRGEETMPHYYGELAETEDADGMPVDVLWNKAADPTETGGPIYIVDQMRDGEFYQHKVLGGFESEFDAEQGYAETWDGGTIGAITEVTPEQFQDWISSGDTKVAYAQPDTTAAVEPEPAPEPTQPEPEVTPEQERRDQVQAERRQRGTEQARQAREVKDTDDLITFAQKLGGINVDLESDVRGRLKGLGTRAVGLPGIEQTGGSGLSLDQLAEAAWEAGYIENYDSQELIDALYEAESRPIYTPAGQEAQAREQAEAEADRQAEAEAQEWADFVNESPDINEVDGETASLMKQAMALDEDATEALMEKDTTEAEFQAQLRELIDERKSAKDAEAAAPAEPQEAVQPDEVEPEAPALIPEAEEDVIGAAIARWEKTPEGQEAIKRSKKEAVEREAAYRAQRKDEFGPEWAREEQALFEFKPLDENNPQFQALSESGKEEVRKIKTEMAEVYAKDPADKYLDVLQYDLEKVVMGELVPPSDAAETEDIAALKTPADHLAMIEGYLAEGEGDATMIPGIINEQGYDAPASITAYEDALRAAGWTPFMKGKGEFWENAKGDELFLSSQGTLAAPIIQYKAFEARSVFDVLSGAMYPDPTSKPLKEIKLSFTEGDETVTHTAEWWVEHVDERIQKAADIRGCA